MCRALINLLENAIDAVELKHGEITVTVATDEQTVNLTIADNGIGILPVHAALVWEPGFSTKQSSGFGLPFVREIVEKNGGTIVIESLEQHGTRVIISLQEACDIA